MAKTAITTADFNALANEISRIIEIDLETVHRKIAFDLFSGVVLKTPVDTGRARASWRVGIGAINTSVQSEGQKQPGAEAATTAGSAALQNMTLDKPVWITNSLAYIGALEAGHSKQSPNGMVQLTLAEVRADLSRLVS